MSQPVRQTHCREDEVPNAFTTEDIPDELLDAADRFIDQSHDLLASLDIATLDIATAHSGTASSCG